nr:MAG TPA: hypothetical protein [Caudoviricetes sp.]
MGKIDLIREKVFGNPTQQVEKERYQILCLIQVMLYQHCLKHRCLIIGVEKTL